MMYDLDKYIKHLSYCLHESNYLWMGKPKAFRCTCGAEQIINTLQEVDENGLTVIHFKLEEWHVLIEEGT